MDDETPRRFTCAVVGTAEVVYETDVLFGENKVNTSNVRRQFAQGLVRILVMPYQLCHRPGYGQNGPFQSIGHWYPERVELRVR